MAQSTGSSMRARFRWARYVAVAVILSQATIAPFGVAHAVPAADHAGTHHAGIAHHHCGEHAQGVTGSKDNGHQSPPCCANGACQCSCPLLLALARIWPPLALTAVAPVMVFPESERIDRGAPAPLLRPPIA